MFKKVDHIGIAVEDLEAVVRVYTELLGKGPEHRETVAEQKATTAFFAVGETNLEFLQSTDPEGPIGRFIAKQGRGGIHHICLAVDDIETVLAQYKEAGIKLIDETPRVGAHGKKVAFVHPKSTGGVLLELSQKV